MTIKAHPLSDGKTWVLVDPVGDEGQATVTATDERKIKAQLADVAIRVYGWHRPEIVLNNTFGMGKKNTPETVVSAIAEFAVNGENDIVAERLTKALFVEPETLDALKRMDAFTKTLIDAAENNGKTSVNAKGGTK